MNINDKIKTIENAQAEIQNRLGTARTIAWNLYRKHFHNFFTPGEYGAVFPWLVETPTINHGTLCSGGERIPQAYVSGDVWRIASSIRRDAYRAHEDMLTEKARDYQEHISEFETEIRVLQKRLEREQKRFTKTQKILRRAYCSSRGITSSN